MEIPKKIETTLYINLGVGSYNQNVISINSYSNISTLDGFEDVLLMEVPFSIDVPDDITMEDITNRLVQVLKDEKQKIQAEYHVKLEKVQEKIDNLLALPGK